MLVTAASYAVVTIAALVGLPTRAALAISRNLGGAWWRAGPILAACLVWGAISLVWRLVEGEQIPLTIYVAAFLWVGWSAQRVGVPLGGVWIAAGEQAAIMLTAVAWGIGAGAVRLY